MLIGLAACCAWLAEQTGDAGARLHLRFVALFAAAAVLPALIVAFFFGVLVTRGVDSWFNARVENRGGELGQGRQLLHRRAGELPQRPHPAAWRATSTRPGLRRWPTRRWPSRNTWLAQAADNGFAAAYVLDGEGRVLARAEWADAPAVPGRRRPPPSRTPTPAATRWNCARSRRTDLMRALYRLRSFPNAYLYVVRPVERGVFAHLRETEASLADYRAGQREPDRDPGRLLPGLPRGGAGGAAGRGLGRDVGGQQHRRADRAAGAGGGPRRGGRPRGARRDRRRTSRRSPDFPVLSTT